MSNSPRVGQDPQSANNGGMYNTEVDEFTRSLQESVDEDDPLALCLSAFIAITDRPTSVAALLAGLPLDKGRLTPDLLQRALDRAGYSSRLVKRPISLYRVLNSPFRNLNLPRIIRAFASLRDAARHWIWHRLSLPHGKAAIGSGLPSESFGPPIASSFLEQFSSISLRWRLPCS